MENIRKYLTSDVLNRRIKIKAKTGEKVNKKPRVDFSFGNGEQIRESITDEEVKFFLKKNRVALVLEEAKNMILSNTINTVHIGKNELINKTYDVLLVQFENEKYLWMETDMKERYLDDLTNFAVTKFKQDRYIVFDRLLEENKIEALLILPNNCLNNFEYVNKSFYNTTRIDGVYNGGFPNNRDRIVSRIMLDNGDINSEDRDFILYMINKTMHHYPSTKGYQKWGVRRFENYRATDVTHMHIDGKRYNKHMMIYMEYWNLIDEFISRDKDGYFINNQASLHDEEIKQKTFRR